MKSKICLFAVKDGKISVVEKDGEKFRRMRKNGEDSWELERGFWKWFENRLELQDDEVCEFVFVYDRLEEWFCESKFWRKECVGKAWNEASVMTALETVKFEFREIRFHGSRDENGEEANLQPGEFWTTLRVEKLEGSEPAAQPKVVLKEVERKDETALQKYFRLQMEAERRKR